MVNVKNLPREIFQDDISREAKFYIGIGRESFNKKDSANIYRFSRGVISKYKLDNYSYCQLSYNKPYQVVYFKFIKINQGQKTPPWYFKITKDRMVRKISALRFARKYNLNQDSYVGRYPCHESNISENSVELAIDLNEKGQIEE